MPGVELHGSWHVRVVRNDAAWPQRVVVTGAVSGVIPGQVGASVTVGGGHCTLTIEHDPGGGWRQSPYVQAGPVKERDGRATRIVESKDHYWPGDSDPNDLVLQLEHIGTAMEVIGAPEITGVVGSDLRYLAVTVQNTGYKTFGYDAVFDITDAGRRALAQQGVTVESWGTESLRATGQEAFGRAVGLSPLDVGARDIVYFPVYVGTAAVPEATDVEFELVRAGGEGRRRGRRERHVVRMKFTRADRPSAPTPGALMVSGDIVDVHPMVRPAAPPRSVVSSDAASPQESDGVATG